MFTFSARLKRLKLISHLTRSTKCVSYFNSCVMSSNWNCIYITGPDKCIYFRRRARSQNETESRVRSTVSKLLTANDAMYLFFPKLSDSFSGQNAYVQSAISSHKVYRQNGIWPSSLFAHSVMFDTRELSGNTFRRGVFCSIPDEYKQDTVDKMTNFLRENTNLSAYKLVQCVQTGLYRMLGAETLSTTNDGPPTAEDTDFDLELIDRSELKEVQQLEELTSPIFFRSEIRPVFHDYESARLILEPLSLSGVSEVKELLDITDKNVATKPLSTVDQSLIHPFVVVEGMDATGKTTLTEELEKRMGAARLFTPPPQLTSLRVFFDKYPEIIRRAYYSMGNYIVARDIIKECQNRPVIMDRFWHSTAAYGIANETSLEDLPGQHHAVYGWPKDLLQPTIVLFLTVSEDVRKQRLSGRGINPTFEEKSLDKDQLFRQRLCESYRRMKEPSCIEIDASGTVEEVLNMALEVLSSHGVKLDK